MIRSIYTPLAAVLLLSARGFFSYELSIKISDALGSKSKLDTQAIPCVYFATFCHE